MPDPEKKPRAEPHNPVFKNTFAPDIKNKWFRASTIFQGLKWGVFKMEKLPKEVQDGVHAYLDYHRPTRCAQCGSKEIRTVWGLSAGYCADCEDDAMKRVLKGLYPRTRRDVDGMLDTLWPARSQTRS